MCIPFTETKVYLLFQFRELCHLIEALQSVEMYLQFPFVPFFLEGLYNLLFRFIREIDVLRTGLFYIHLLQKGFELRLVRDEILRCIPREKEEGYIVLEGDGSAEFVYVLQHHFIDLLRDMPIPGGICLEALFHPLQSIHDIGHVLYFYDTVRVPEQDISVRHGDFPEFDGSGVLDEPYPQSQSSWDDLFYGIRLFSVEEHRVVPRSDKREFVVRGIELEEYGCDEYPPLDLLFQFVVEGYEKFLEPTDFLREFEEQFGKKGNGEASLHPMPCSIPYVKDRLVSFLVISERIADDLVLSVDFPEKIEAMNGEIADIFGESAMHDGEKLGIGIPIGYVFYRSRLDKKAFDILQRLLSLQVLFFFRALQLGAFYEKGKPLEDRNVFFPLQIRYLNTRLLQDILELLFFYLVFFLFLILIAV